MTHETKGRSPFYPMQPVPVELFVGRGDQIRHIMQRAAGQVALGKPIAVYISGEYGIGKSSLARYVQLSAEREYGLLGIYATLGGVGNLDDVGAAILGATVQSGTLLPKAGEHIRNWLARYVGDQSVFGITLKASALKQDGPNIAQGPLPFLREVYEKAHAAGVKGIFLVMDEINGIASQPLFAHFLKDIVDSNALSRSPVPLLLMLCGTEERRRQIITNHIPVERIFDVVPIEPLGDQEIRRFFEQAFAETNMTIESGAMDVFIKYSAGFPRLMHLLGESAYWMDEDGVVSESDALRAAMQAAEDIGRKYVDAQVYQALRSKDYKSILRKIARSGLDMTFRKSELSKGLTETEKRKLNNFLQRMKKLNVIRSGDDKGEYEFLSRMVHLYIWIKETAAIDARNA